MSEPKKNGRPATGWVKVAFKVSKEVKAAIDKIPTGDKSKAIDDAIREKLGIKRKEAE